jgi:glycosyltransferase involved in cell wall biosynthesis
MDGTDLSVIVPTRNRSAVLRLCLERLLEQEPGDLGYEVIVVDDGSEDDTGDVVSQMMSETERHLLYVRQAARGPAAARNAGVRSAQGTVVLFTGDDILASPWMVAEHIFAHRELAGDHVAVLGYVTWAREIEVTPFMTWLENGGPQFKYWAIEDGENVSYFHFYTCNISLKRRFLLEQGGFDEDFPYASYEDIELGRRLAGYGLRIVYRPDAVGYHWHPTSLEDAIARMRRVGASYVIYCRKTGEWPRLRGDGASPRWRRVASGWRHLLSHRLASVLQTRMVAGGLYGYLMSRAMEEGIQDVLQASDSISAQLQR